MSGTRVCGLIRRERRVAYETAQSARFSFATAERSSPTAARRKKRWREHNESVTSLAIPVAVLSRARRAADAFTQLTGVDVDATEVLAGRAGLLGLSPQGRISAGGATRLMRSGDGWCALTLSRQDDVDAVPALLESDAVGDDPWPPVQDWVAGNASADVTARARLLGLPVAALGETRAAPPRITTLGAAAPPRKPPGLLVADLSSMWAGPLCGQLLARAGATVVKVETAARPDGTRSGPSAFFDWMNSGKLSYAVDFDEPSGLTTAAGGRRRRHRIVTDCGTGTPGPRPDRHRASRRPGLAADHRPRFRRRAGRLGGVRRRRRCVRRFGRRHR